MPLRVIVAGNSVLLEDGVVLASCDARRLAPSHSAPSQEASRHPLPSCTHPLP